MMMDNVHGAFLSFGWTDINFLLPSCDINPPYTTCPALNNTQTNTVQYIVSYFACDQDEEDFLFEKGDLNLWAEPVQWVKLLHRHLGSLVVSSEQATGSAGPDRAHQIHALSTRARAQALSSRRALDTLPALPQFSCTTEHTRLLLRHQRATLALDVLERLT